MKLLAWVLAILLNCTGHQPIQPGEDAFSVMTFNVRHRNEAPGAPRLDKYTWAERSPEIVRTIREQDPDVLVLQELNDRSWIGEDPVHDSVQSLMLNELHASGEYSAYLNSSDPYLFTNDCDAISQNVVTRSPKPIFFKTEKFRCLISGSARLVGEVIDGVLYHRYASWVILQQLGTGSRYFVLNTHLAAGKNEPIRIEAIGQIIPLVQSKSKDGDCQLPVILAGDLNAVPGSNPLNLITEQLGLRDSYRGPDRTVNAWGTLSSRLDYVLHSTGLESVNAYVVHTSGSIPASDHLPVKATILPSKYDCL
jgi:endonuclease/exonuclease/phosphatase family metal-dependent hydrolase